MKKIKFSLFFLVLLFLPNACIKAQGLVIGSGGNLVVTGQGFIVANDAKFTNNGTFTAGNSELVIEGSTSDANSEIGGSSTSCFYKVKINKSSNGLQLGNNIQIDNNLTFVSGDLNLNGNDITLKPSGGMIVGETEVDKIWGISGDIIQTLNLDAPTNFDPGNMGIEITSTANFGMTTIKRGHKQQTSTGGGIGISRYFDISPTNNSGLDATLVFHYMDSELAGIIESDLDMWRYDGSEWYEQNATLDVVNNTVTKTGIPAFSMWTLGSPYNNPLPVELISFNAALQDKSISLIWVTASELNNKGFEIQKSKDGVDWKPLSFVKGKGNTSKTNRYSFVDYSPNHGANYYRLKQIDFDGEFKYSNVVNVQIEKSNNSISIFPNPMKNSLHILNTKGKLLVYNMLGQVVLESTLKDKSSVFDVSILQKGQYIVRVEKEDGKFVNRKLIKQ